MKHLIAASMAFFLWTTQDGVMNFTDDPNRIPAAYAPEAKERSWDTVREETVQNTAVDKYRARLAARLAELRTRPKATAVVDPSITTVHERRVMLPGTIATQDVVVVGRNGVTVAEFISPRNQRTISGE